ncbi:mannose-ethanolamine phosphotransferase gpi13 [Binucleata daphniae]
MHTIKIAAIFNIISIYFYFTGLFKLKKPKSNVTSYKLDKKYDNLVFILLDGLRIDGACRTSAKSLYHNNMKFVNTLPYNNKQLFLSVSGVPTATSIRVRSILTGITSNFLSGTDTFTHSKITEDSFINKIANETHYFYGDDTWIDLFPVLKANSVTIPAYGKDRTLKAEKVVMNKLVNDIGKYTYTLAHFSLLDCYGHDFTIFSNECKAIMTEYDRMIEKIYKKMDENTLMVILSDHGVNDDGSHGGGSIKEISSTGIFISKKPFDIYENKEYDMIRDAYMKKIYDNDGKWVMCKEKLKTIHQNDIIPTVCALLGLPIPYNCIGNLIHELVGNDILLYKRVLQQKLESINIAKNIDSICLQEILSLS